MSETLCNLIGGGKIPKADYDALQTKYNTLNTNYNNLNTKYNTLNNNYNTLNTNYKNMTSDRDAWENKYNNMSATLLAYNSGATLLSYPYTYTTSTYYKIVIVVVTGAYRYSGTCSLTISGGTASSSISLNTTMGGNAQSASTGQMRVCKGVASGTKFTISISGSENASSRYAIYGIN